MRIALILLLLTVYLASRPAQADGPLFSDGFEACCSVGGTLSGLAGTGLVLRLSAGAVQEDLPIVANGPWSFRTPLVEGLAWSVSVRDQPTGGPGCQIANPSGTMGTRPVRDVTVHCGAALQWDAGNWNDLWQ